MTDDLAALSADKTRLPLLSICIPTANRGAFLKVMLEALLPQVASHAGEVEVWVIDNASTDDTRGIVEAARDLGPVKYSRNDADIGPIANVVKGPAELATGDFVWVLGDHNLMSPEGVARVVQMIRDHAQLDLFYVNFRCATFPGQWPGSAVGGFDGPYTYMGNPSTSERHVAHWNELIDGGSGICTQVYAHIIRTEVWKQFWANRAPLPEQYTSAISTYPHTWMIANRLFDAPSFYEGRPVITIFNGAQSWGLRSTRAKVYFAGLPDLIDTFAEKKLSSRQVEHARFFAQAETYRIWLELFRDFDWRHASSLFRLSSARCVRHGYLLQGAWRGFMDAQASGTARAFRRVGHATRDAHFYFFSAWRPARWIRARLRHFRNAG